MNTIININDKRWKNVDLDFAKVVSSVLGKGKPNSEIGIILTNDSEIKKLNKKYRGKDAPTNVLSFETGDDVLMGDIYLSYETIEREAEEQNKTFENHLTHLVVHGVLHLMGYDHICDSDAKKMESREIKILKKLKIKNPYLNPKSSISNLALIALFGIISALGFAPYNLWPLTLIGIGGAYYLTLNSELRTMNWRAFTFGAFYAIASFWWVLNSIFVVPELAAQFWFMTIPGVFGIGLVGGLFFGLPFLALRTSPRVRAILFALSWTLILWLREWIFTGFPWNPISNIWLPFPIISNSMALWGALGLTFITIGLIASAIKFRVKDISIFLSLFIIGCGYGYFNIKKSQITEKSAQPILRIVQPATTQADKAGHWVGTPRELAERNVARLIDLAKTETDIKPSLIIFPETAYPYLIADNKLPMAGDINAPVVIGATAYDNGKFYNSMVFADAGGYIQKLYHKSHLVPFGEYRPFGDIIPTPGQFASGDGAENIWFAGFNIAPAICYEIVFTSSLQSPISNLDFVLNITNDTWFGKTQGTYQHLDMARRYAIESGLSVVRANYSGISAFINPDGAIKSSLGIGEMGILDDTPNPSHMTPYRKIGRDWTMFLILLFALTLCQIRKEPKAGSRVKSEGKIFCGCATTITWIPHLRKLCHKWLRLLVRNDELRGFRFYI